MSLKVTNKNQKSKMSLSDEQKKENQRIAQKKYYEANKEKIKNKRKIYYKYNKEKIIENRKKISKPIRLQKDKKYREKNKDKLKEYNKIYREKNKEKIKFYYQQKYILQKNITDKQKEQLLEELYKKSFYVQNKYFYN